MTNRAHTELPGLSAGLSPRPPRGGPAGQPSRARAGSVPRPGGARLGPWRRQGALWLRERAAAAARAASRAPALPPRAGGRRAPLWRAGTGRDGAGGAAVPPVRWCGTGLRERPAEVGDKDAASVFAAGGFLCAFGCASRDRPRSARSAGCSVLCVSLGELERKSLPNFCKWFPSVVLKCQEKKNFLFGNW